MSAPIDFSPLFLNICILESAGRRNFAAGRNRLLLRRRDFVLQDDDARIRTLIQR